MAKRDEKRPRPLDRASPLPLWAQLHADLVRRLRAGAFADAFPGELQLVGDYSVSRHTVREALRRLRDEGVVDARRGRQSVVRTAAIEQPLGSLYSLFASVEARGMRQHSSVLAQDVVRDPDVARTLELDPRTDLFHLARIRYADDEPLACDRLWLPADKVEALLHTDFTHAALYDELAEKCGIRLQGGRERITAKVPDDALRASLGVPETTACLTIERIGLFRRRPFEFRLTDVRGDRFAVIAEWSPQGYRVTADEREPASARP